ncbi:ABC transporter substrate-binding protein [Gordonia sp. NB41Y]|uniref:ABC transporter substrate-binding protein n=1 Tax=Gordonia sp. NB41Y TaxID=875808 RepID=UPI0006C34C8C|nr:ABC transporter substrate-binding protein [Gordonia sp. NB41Y]EMP10918.2 hypothetical protein ISGA_4614 [Gordonia sp. NB41Y]WLP88432.1 ABC transporter substrate-binding protein [Gordonia sp. NB41Y]
MGITACSGASSTTRADNEIVFADVAFISNWQTQAIPSYTAGNIANSLLARLTYYDAANEKLVGWVADKFEQNDNATEFTFHIRDGVTFSDGTPVDAEVVKQNFDLWGNGDEARGIIKNIYTGDYDRAEAVDGSTVKVYLKQPFSSFLYATSSIFYGLQAKKNLDLSLEEQSKIENLVGAGPFVFESQTPDQEIVIKRRDDYAWAPEGAANQGAAHVERVRIKAVPEISSRSGAVSSGQADLARVISPDDEKTLADAGKTIYPVPGVELTAYFGAFRPGNEVVSDVRVRKALQLGADVNTVLKDLTTGSYSAPHGIYTKSEKGVDVTVPYDPERARALLDEAGWVPGADGIRTKNGQRLSLTTDDETQSPASLPIWEAIAQSWRKELGAELVIRKGDVQFSREASTNPQVPLHPMRQWNYGGTATLFGGTNVNGESIIFHADPELRALAEREQASTDPVEQRQIRAELNKVAVTDKAYVIPTYPEVQVFAGSEKLKIGFTGATYPDFHGAEFTN